MIEGTQVGAYRILQRIGSGGMGEVWMAQHTMLGRRAAIKVLHAEFSNRPDIVTRFFNEARAATAISDPGIIQIFDFGHHVDGSAYIVMELLDGEPLDQRLRTHGVLAITDALRLMRQVAGSLGAAHARGIVHRDLKPENLFLTRDPEVAGGERVKILDFGIAKLTEDGHSNTSTSAVMGTPMFMSPEQCRGAGNVDQRSDIYAIGCVLFMLLTGRPPFDADGAGELIAMHLREPAPAPSSRAAWLPPEIDRLVLRCLAKDPAQRFSSGDELAAAIGALLATSPTGTPTPGATHPAPAAAVAQTTLSTASGASMPRARALPKRSRAGVVVGLAAVVVVGGGVAYVAGHASRATETRVGMELASPPAAAPTPPGAVAPVLAPATAPLSKPIVPDVNASLASSMKAVLASFVAWSHDHAGAPCPDAMALGASVQDPWGHQIRLTCTDQPANQIVGAISLGPDGEPGTGDDIASWQLARDVTNAVAGPRWVAAPASPPSPKTVAHPTKRSPATVAPRASAAPSAPPPNSMQLDDNGMPIVR